LIANDVASASELVGTIQQKVPIGAQLKSLIYSDDEKLQVQGLYSFHIISNDNRLLPMVLEPQEISEFTAINSLMKSGYTIEQAKQSMENFKATPKADRKLPSKAVNEALIDAAEGMTTKQYALAKEMVAIMSNSNVADTVIEDYLDNLKDKFITKVDTTLTFGGLTILNEGGSVPSVSEPILIEAYNTVLDKVIADNPTLTKDDLTIVHKNNSADVVVVLAKDTSIQVSKGSTNMNDLTRAIVLNRANKPKTTVKSATGQEEVKPIKERVQDAANFIVEDVPKYAGEAVDTISNTIDKFTEAITPNQQKQNTNKTTKRNALGEFIQ